MNNFTPRAHKALALARQAAARLNHSHVGVEHLLLGLVKLGQGVAVNVLLNLGLNLDIVRVEVEKSVEPGSEPDQSGNFPYSMRMKEVMALADREAMALGHAYVGTEHLLLGLMGENFGVAARVLRSLGLEIERVRSEVMKEIDPNSSWASLRAIAPPSRPPQGTASGSPPSGPAADELDAEGIPKRFTPRTQKALALARNEAARLGHNSVGTEHLLLGLINLGQGMAVRALLEHGLDLTAVRNEVGKQVGYGASVRENLPEIDRLEAEIEDIRGRKEAAVRADDFEKAAALRDAEADAKAKLRAILGSKSSVDLPYTPAAKSVLVQASEEHKARRQFFIGTEHILMALLSGRDDPATRVLQVLGVDLEKTRTSISSQLDPNFIWTRPGSPS